MYVHTLKDWLDQHTTPFVWQRILIKLLPEFRQAGFYLHTIKDETELNPTLIQSINKCLYELYQIQLPNEILYYHLMNQELKGTFHKDRNAYIVQSEPMIFHCHHYNTYLQAVIEDTGDYLNVQEFLISSAQELAYAQLSGYYAQNKLQDVKMRKKIAEDFFAFCGFGKIDLSALTNVGGKIIAKSDHYGIGWKSKFGTRPAEKSGVSYFTTGYLAGATEAIFDFDLGFAQGTQLKCLAKGDSESVFQITLLAQQAGLSASPQEGIYQTYTLPAPADTPVDYAGIREALTGMPLEGTATDGLIDAFGVLLTRMYSNYYTLISYRFLKAFEQKMGDDGIFTACQLLTEAGHVCAFNTFGGIMQSAEWNGLIRPMLKTKEDWVHGIVAVVNALCWGFWEIVELIPDQKLVLKVTSGYESNAYLKIFGKSSYPISFLATGGTGGIMNLIYNTEITQKPTSLDDSFYKALYLNPRLFVSRQVECRAMGAEFDLFEVTHK